MLTRVELIFVVLMVSALLRMKC